MSKIEELKQLMSIEGCNTAPDIKRHFDHIAKLLFECFVIEYDGSCYLFNDIEFYYYNKNHRDIITHPRISKAMRWYKIKGTVLLVCCLFCCLISCALQRLLHSLFL